MNSDMKHWLGLAVAVATGLVGYGALKESVSGHEKRLEVVEADQRMRAASDFQVVQRLAAIETQIRFLVEAENRRQAKEDRR